MKLIIIILLLCFTQGCASFQTQYEKYTTTEYMLTVNCVYSYSEFGPCKLGIKYIGD